MAMDLIRFMKIENWYCVPNFLQWYAPNKTGPMIYRLIFVSRGTLSPLQSVPKETAYRYQAA
jgi:hypothetical protein